jgi:hypothetical protein
MKNAVARPPSWHRAHLLVLSALLAATAGCASHRARRAAAPPTALDVTVAGERLRYGLHLAAQANLIYQLDCVSGAIICARPVYQAHWARLGLDAADEAALAEWKTRRGRHGGEIRRLDEPPPDLPLLLPTGAADLGERQRIAGLTSRTPAAYQAALSLLSSEEDARRLGALLARFTPRFQRWWQDQGAASGAASFAAFARLLADPFFDASIEQALRFYQAELPAGPVLEIHLMVQPRAQRRLTTAHQLERHAAVDAPEGSAPESHIDVIAHEIFHYLFARMRGGARRELLGLVAASGDPQAAAAFGVLDESVAAALGNGLIGRHYLPPARFARRLERPDGLDAYRAASLVARALLPDLEGLLRRGVPLASKEFLRTYLRAARAMYEGGPPRPVDSLHSQVTVAAPRFATAARRLQEACNAGYPYLREYGGWGPEAQAFLSRRPLISAALFLGPDEAPGAVLEALGAGREALAALAAASARSRGLVFALPRAAGAYAFLLVAPDPATMEELADRLAAFGSLRAGALIEVPR